MSFRITNNKGFTLIELIIAISIVGILAAVVLILINPAQMIERSNYSTAVSSLNQIARAAQLYETNYGIVPDDVRRNIPPEFMPYLGKGSWPNGPFKNSVYDWDNWTGMTCWDGSPGGIQVSLRQLTYKGNSDYVLYYTIQGDGIPHCEYSNFRGECVNCPSRYP